MGCIPPLESKILSKIKLILIMVQMTGCPFFRTGLSLTYLSWKRNKYVNRAVDWILFIYDV